MLLPDGQVQARKEPERELLALPLPQVQEPLRVLQLLA